MCNYFSSMDFSQLIDIIFHFFSRPYTFYPNVFHRLSKNCDVVVDSRCTSSVYRLAGERANKISTGHDEGSMPNHKWLQPKIKQRQFSLLGACSAHLSVVSLIYIRSLGLTCCEMEKPIIISPSGTSQNTVAESARRFMTDTLTGAGGRSGGKDTETEGSIKTPTSPDIKSSVPSVSTLHLEGLKHCVSTLNAPQVFVLS